MRHAERLRRRFVAALAAGLACSSVLAAPPGAVCGASPSDRPVYMTFDTGHMGVAPLVADVLNRHQVKVAFFLANERTRNGGASLDDEWAPWWKARTAEGHVFGSHTFDHAIWLADTPTGFRLRPTAGPEAGRTVEMSAADYCATLKQSAQRFNDMTGATMAPIFRAAGGKTSPKLLATAKACGWNHVPWADGGFLGDELPSDKFPNKLLLRRALREIRSGDILLAHLGIWSRKEVWAPAVLEPLIVGLKERGFCFASLREHPNYRAVIPR